MASTSPPHRRTTPESTPEPEPPSPSRVSSVRERSQPPNAASGFPSPSLVPPPRPPRRSVVVVRSTTRPPSRPRDARLFDDPARAPRTSGRSRKFQIVRNHRRPPRGSRIKRKLARVLTPIANHAAVVRPHRPGLWFPQAHHPAARSEPSMSFSGKTQSPPSLSPDPPEDVPDASGSHHAFASG